MFTRQSFHIQSNLFQFFNFTVLWISCWCGVLFLPLAMIVFGNKQIYDCQSFTDKSLNIKTHNLLLPFRNHIS